MSLLTNQIIFHQDLAGLFSDERRITPYERKQGFAWYLCLAEVAAQQVWLLVNDEFGYVELLEHVDFSAGAVEQHTVG
jgi:hypothetical protein